ncbi:MAG: repair protein RadC [Candidatus Taylorbacteria bacterium]|nr:repair protein RadC [Candidatus Taylorbacteria bacterium]
MNSYIITDTDKLLDFVTEQNIYQKSGSDSVAKGIRQYPLKIHDLPEDSRPREKLMKQGPEALTLPELLAVILGTGSTKEPLLSMSNRIIREYGERSVISENNAKKLAEDLSIPEGKACQIVACGEIGRRLYQKNSSGFTVIRSAQDVHEYLRDMHNLPKEHLRGLYLNSHNRIIHDEVISIGTINANLVHPREVFRPAVEYSAAAIVLAHNHPSGVLTPSAQDVEITNQLIEAGKVIGINILDHVIITKDSFSSISANY